MTDTFTHRLQQLVHDHTALLERRNAVDPTDRNGIFERWTHPVLTAEHAPLFWRYDLDRTTNPHLLERIGVNAAFNAGAMEWQGKFIVVARVEGNDRKSFFAIAESPTGVDRFRFWDYPIDLPQLDEPDTNVYDMRLTPHEDGWIYGVFCTERKDRSAPAGDTSSATAGAGIVRTKDLRTWQRLPDLKSRSPQQRNVVLHPRFVDGKYALYTRPQDGFIDTGAGGGIGWALSDSIDNASIGEERIVDPKVYHTIKEVKNGDGAPPIETDKGWLHIAHGVRNTAAGLRYVIYAFLCHKDRPWEVIARPAGHLIAPRGDERVGDVSNVCFINGLIARPGGEVFLYYASSDTRLHVATSTVDRLLDYVLNTPADPLHSHLCVQQRSDLIRRNLALLERADDPLLRSARQ